LGATTAAQLLPPGVPPQAQARVPAVSASAQAQAAAPRAEPSAPDAAPSAFDGSARPRVAVIGGGIAGLSAVHELARHGIAAQVFEAETRLGGRMKSEPHASGLVVDAGAEFVSSTHDALLAMMKELGIKPLRRHSVARKKTFFYDGRPMPERAFQRRMFREAAAPLRTLVRDDAALRAAIQAKDADVLRRFDSKTIGAYLDEIGAPPILRAFVKAVVDSESGRDYRTLSSVVLFECLSVDLAKRHVAALPDEDEVFRIDGGAGRIISKLLERHAKTVRREHRLTAIESDDGKRFRLTFQTPQGPRVVEADHVILAVPPPALKDVLVRMPGWTPELRKAVDAVEYGSHLKLSLVFKGRPWLKLGHSGGGFTDSGYAFWESSEGQKADAGSVTFLGRAPEPGVTPAQLAWTFLHQLSRIFPGIIAQYRGFRAEIWQRSYPFADGPGDPYGFVLTWLGRRAFSKFSADPIGNLHWAGDLYSSKSPAYMNGAVETGTAAAQAIARAQATP
jgi:monoamine oxidase